MKVENNPSNRLVIQEQSEQQLENTLENKSKYEFKTKQWKYLLLILIGIYLPVQIFELIAIKIWQDKTGFPWDVPILLAVHQTAQYSTGLITRSHLDIFAVILAKIGSPITLVPITLLIALGLMVKKRWRFSIYLIITGLGSAMINLMLKQLMHRTRPHLWESTYQKADFAFPSGHAMASLTFVILLMILTWDTRWRFLTLIFSILFVPTIAWTRLYLGVHYPSDIFAGWLVTIAWCITTFIILKPHFNAENIEHCNSEE